MFAGAALLRPAVDKIETFASAPSIQRTRWAPPSFACRLAGARYQLDVWLVQVGIVGGRQQQEDPGFESRGKYAYTDTICRNVLTSLASRFQTHGIR